MDENKISEDTEEVLTESETKTEFKADKTYDLLISDTPNYLSEKVNERLRAGFQLYGSPFGQLGKVYQAVLRVRK